MSEDDKSGTVPNPERKVIRLGYVGGGFMAQHVHLPNFSSLSDCRLVALAENRADLGPQVARRFGIPNVYHEHRDLLDAIDIDAVAVSADYAQQGEIAADLLRAGKHVFMEKPMAVSVEQATKILEAERAGGARLMVGYMKRYDPGNRLVRQTVREWNENRSKGKLLLARNHGFCGNWLVGLDTSRMIQSKEALKPVSSESLLPKWLPANHRENYVAYLQQYTHNVNLLRFILDISRLEQVEVRNVDLDDDGFTGIVTLQLGGTRCVIESGKTQFHSWEEHTQIYFEGGWVRAWPNPLFAQPSNCQVEIYEGGESAGYQYPVPQPASAWHYREEAAHFLLCLKNGSPFDSSGEDALLDVSIFEEIYRRHLNAA
ncbi:MAG TPA: Gfo/Idh/MocA family oxidoreductase [Chthoniobacterales bacterium]|nr:Gfo/Idh/MocA family oxidoreductase [Chthoniobacterales bacterium]